MAFILFKDKKINFKLPFEKNVSVEDSVRDVSLIKNKKNEKVNCDPLIQPDDPSKVCTIDADGNFVILNTMNPFIDKWIEDEDLKQQLYNSSGWWTPALWGSGLINIVHAEETNNINDLFTVNNEFLMIPEDFPENFKFEYPNNNEYFQTNKNGIKSWNKELDEGFIFTVVLNSNYNPLIYNQFVRALLSFSNKIKNKELDKIYVQLILENDNIYGSNWFNIRIYDKRNKNFFDLLLDNIYDSDFIYNNWEWIYYNKNELENFFFDLFEDAKSDIDPTIEY